MLMAIKWDHEFLNTKDCDGRNILHLAVADKQTETVKYLLKTNQIGVNEMDAYGNTTLDILAESCRDIMMDLSIGECLREAGGIRAKDIIPKDWCVSSSPAYLGEDQSKNPPSQGDWLSKKRETIMVVASLTATMAFQAGVNPPGGVWQENGTSHKAGEAVMAYNHARSYRYFFSGQHHCLCIFYQHNLAADKWIALRA
ncbi:putative 17.3 kDa class II heat shock protein-like [Capsicum annuum]|nr:putative 17.3 kDa class II heat shock protein-like [Capsicum annuum]